jgi:hypothetical protein
MGKTLPTSLLSHLFRFGLLLIVLCFWVSGCASFPGRDLPKYTYADLAPASEKKTCLVFPENSDKRTQEFIDAAIAMFEKSGYFLKAPERCTPNGDEKQNLMKVDFRSDLKAVNLIGAVISGFVCGATLTIVPAYARDEFVMTVQFRRNDQLVKEYVYREHMNSWIHLSMLFMMSGHSQHATIHEIYDRMVMNFLYEYSRDIQQGTMGIF